MILVILYVAKMKLFVPLPYLTSIVILPWFLDNLCLLENFIVPYWSFRVCMGCAHFI